MRVLVVTSDVTYLPENYTVFLEKLCKQSPHIYAVAFLQNMNLSILTKGLGLIALGVKSLGWQLLKNAATIPFQTREKKLNQKEIQIIKWPTMNCPEAIDWVKHNQIDLIVNARTRCIYKSEILKAPKLGCINIHHGLLPTYRGTMCDLYALAEKRPAGFTIHQMNEKIDAGKIIKVVNVNNGEKELSYLSYLKKTMAVEAHELNILLNEINANGKLPEGQLNKTDQVVFTRNPDRQKIKELKALGLV